MTYTYKPSGVCAREIQIELEGETVKQITFVGGCNGNLQGISRLVEGMEVQETIRRLRGLQCGTKDTSCPDQLSRALLEALEQTPAAQ